MPGIELHADFDRTGRITRSARERGARQQWPGAIVVPNLDRDRRRLPGQATNGRSVPADFDDAVATRRDDELLPLEIRVAPGSLQAGEQLLLHCSGIMHTRIEFADQAGVILRRPLGEPALYRLPRVPANGVLRIRMQARTLAGGSFGRVASLDVRYTHDRREETRFELTLLRRDANDTDHPEDHGRFSIAPFVVADRSAAARRVYIVESVENQPSITDVGRVTRRIGLPLIRVATTLTGRDSWIQDQYQHALLPGPARTRELILHMPRLAKDNGTETVTDSSQEFINAHFRSRNVALFNGLWDRAIPVRRQNGPVFQIDFRELVNWVKRMHLVYRLVREMNALGRRTGNRWRSFDPAYWIDAMARMRAQMRRLGEAVGNARASASAEASAQLAGYLSSVESLYEHLRDEIRVQGRGAGVMVTSNIGSNDGVVLRGEHAYELYARGVQMQRSANYGGNIESTPPVDGAPLGKIIIGNDTDPENGEEYVDPDVLKLFTKQRKQPLVEIKTRWLDVGHVDEVAAVVPHGGSASGFSVLHASPRAALDLLQRAEQRHRAGRTHSQNLTDPLRRPPRGIDRSRLMDEGTVPVTRLFRGRAWIHVEERGEPGKAPRNLLPPRTFRHLCEEYGTYNESPSINEHRIGIVPGVGEPRKYPADMTIAELLWSELDDRGRSSNHFFNERYIEPICNTLAGELNGIELLPVPVLFDRAPDIDVFARDNWQHNTSALTVNLVNLQYLNGHILVPTPYGPRMRLEDAIAVVRASMQAQNMPSEVRSVVGRRLVRAQRLTQRRVWVERVEPVTQTRGRLIQSTYRGILTKDDVIATFRDSFPGASDQELERRIIGPNRSKFTAAGELRERFSEFRISDGMVDLFELWMAAIAEHLGVRLRFVDSWFYHVRFGEIHCGTNVLRRTAARGLAGRNTWDAPDHRFRNHA